MTEQALIAAVAMLLIKEVVQFIRSKQKDNSESIQKLTVSMTRLEVQIEHLNKVLEEMYRIKKDVDVLHSKLRDLRVN